ncbi:MAG: hypothetical protein ACFFD2_24355, partial [Promethearchaeota archaeon]
ISKSTAGGVAVGISTWIITFLLYLGIIWIFDFNAMLDHWTSLGNTFYLDIGIGLGILVIFGVIGGYLTSRGSD